MRNTIGRAATVILVLAAWGAARADFAAIAYSEGTGRYAWSYGHGSRAGAENDALARCGAGDARVVVWTENGWCALALSDGGAYGYGWGPNRATAERLALRQCLAAGGRNAHIAAYAYSGR